MTTDEKRLTMIKMISNADQKGINTIWNNINKKNKGVTKEEFEKAFKDIADNEYGHDFLTTAFLALICVEITEKLF